VNGKADTGPLYGNFNQCAAQGKHPGLKWCSRSAAGPCPAAFTQAAQNPAAFANSCYAMVKDSRWADVFDGIDLDWYPNACGLSCTPAARRRSRTCSRRCGPSSLRGPGDRGDHRRRHQRGKIDAADYRAPAVRQLVQRDDYDYFGAWAPTGPTPRTRR